MINNEEFGFKYKSFHANNAIHWNNLANQRQFELSKQLLTFSALILTVSTTVIVSFSGISFQSQPLQSFLLLLSWVFSLTSITCGLIQLGIDASYFNYLSNDEGKRESVFSSLPFNEAKSKTDSMPSTDPRGDERGLCLQQVFFALGLFFITISAIFILFFNVS